jgi:heme/copper-type cytochrome/quinol oxidase subunit 2
MRSKIRKIAGAVSIALMTAPAVAMGQSWAPDADVPQASVMDIVRNFMKWLLIIVGIMGVIGFAIAGILYLTAAGDEDRIQSAKRAMIYSIVGIVVAMLGLVVMTAAYRMLGAQSGF